MRKFFSALLAAVMVLSLVPFSVSADDGLGFTVEDGTAYIYTADELMAYAKYSNIVSDSWNDITGEYELDVYNVEIMADIDLAGYEWYPIDFYVNDGSRRTFNGNGHTISNMTITVNESKGTDPDDFKIPEDDLGFFSNVENADIKDLSVQGTINVECYGDDTNIGGLCGDIDSDTVITNCHVDVVITVVTDDYDNHEIGGLVGELDDAYVYNSTSKAVITVTCEYMDSYTLDIGGFIGDFDDSEIAGCRSEGSVTVNYDGVVKAGGIAGESEYTDIMSSSSSVDVTVNHRGNNSGTAYIGGFIGESQSVYIYNSFSTSDLVGKDITTSDGYNEIGGIVGEAEDAEEGIHDALVIENCYFDGTITVVADEDYDIGGIVGDVESDVDLEIANVWSSCSDIGIDTDNVNGDPLPEMSVLLAALNENAKALDEYGIPHITLWSLKKDGRPGVGMIERIVEQPTAELPRFVITQNNGEPTYQWQVGIEKESDAVCTEQYYWILNENNIWVSTNHDHNTYSELKFGLNLKANDVIEFEWKSSCEEPYYEDSGYYFYDYLEYTIYDDNNFIHGDTISGQTDWEKVQYTVLADGTYYLTFKYCKDGSDSYYDDCGYVKFNFNEYFEDIEGAESNILNVNDPSLDGKWVYCIATYPDGEIVVSDMFKYDYDAIDRDELNKPVQVYKDNGGFVLGYDVDEDSESAPTMVPLFFGTTVRVYDAANGTITPNGIPMIIGGMEMTFKFIPDEGYEVADVLVNGESVGAVEALTIDGWQGYVKLTAVFEPIEP